jgi:taurine dioxygenase
LITAEENVMTKRQLERRIQYGLPLNIRRVPDDWDDKPYTLFQVAPLSPTIGAEITGIDITVPLSDDAVRELRRAILEWKVLFFRDQPMELDAYVRFGRIWGEFGKHPMQTPGPVPEVNVFIKGVTSRGEENLWHSDDAFMPKPTAFSILRSLHVPEVGGDTLFADMAAAYDNLPLDLQKELDGRFADNRHAVLWSGHEYSPERIHSEEHIAKMKLENRPVLQPVIRTHPETGRKSIFVDLAHTTRIDDMDPVRSDELLDILISRAAVPEYQCRFRWTDNTVAIWDNRTVQHYASSDYYPQARSMQRMIIAGDAAV